jgi:hypothetical protein
MSSPASCHIRYVYVHVRCILIFALHRIRLKRAPSSNKPTASDHQDSPYSGHTEFKPGATHHSADRLRLRPNPHLAGVYEKLADWSLLGPTSSFFEPLGGPGCVRSVFALCALSIDMYTFKISDEECFDVFSYCLSNAARLVNSSVHCQPNRLSSNKVNMDFFLCFF